jgi:WD40 repeat protein/transcriptional regulator with XRE-family HTH domain
MVEGKGPKINVVLREERLRRRWSQQELADRLGTTKISVQRWERSITTPSPYFRLKLTTLFGKSFEELGFGREEHQQLAEVLPESEMVSEPEVVSERHLQDAKISNVDQLLVPQNTEAPLDNQDPVSEAHVIQKPAHHHILSRRSIFAGIGGACLASALSGGLWWYSGSRSVSSPSPIPTLTPLYNYHAPFYINDVSWSSRGTLIASPIGDKTVQIHQAMTGEVSLIYPGHHGYVNCAQCHPLTEGLVASGSSDRTVQVWDPLTGHCHVTYRGHTSSVLYLAWSHDGTRIASGSSDATVQVWNALTGEHISTYRGHTGRVWSIRWASTDDRIVSAGDDGRLHVWYPQTATPSLTFVYTGPQNSTINEVDWSPDGRWIASAHADSHVYLWDASTGGHVLTYADHTASVRTARWMPDGKYIASGGVDNTVQVWNATTGQKLLSNSNYADDVLEVAWSLDGKRLATASKDHSMQVCSIQV